MRPGIDERLAENPDEFAEAAQALMEDPQLRRQMGERALEDVSGHFMAERFLQTLARSHLGAARRSSN